MMIKDCTLSPREFLEMYQNRAQTPSLALSQINNPCLPQGISLIDVRAPIEWEHSHFPDSLNLPILTNEERQMVGTIYKKEGPEAAIALGHKLVSGTTKRNRIEQWLSIISCNPKSVITCLRGGMRSQLTQEWCLAEGGVLRPRLEGGYKSLRTYLSETLSHHLSSFSSLSPSGSNILHFWVVSGPTGAGKTRLLQDLVPLHNVVDLEGLANHRGSAFGGFEKKPQPSQATFENRLALRVNFIMKSLQDLKPPESNQEQSGVPNNVSNGILGINRVLDAIPFSSKIVLIEDESRLVGKCVIPEILFTLMRTSPVILINEALDVRVENTLEEYVLQPLNQFPHHPEVLFQRYINSMKSISKKLGSAHTQSCIELILEAQKQYLSKGDIQPNRIWIEKLLTQYYDPFYLNSLKKRNPQILFRGSFKEVKDFLIQANSSLSSTSKFS